MSGRRRRLIRAIDAAIGSCDDSSISLDLVNALITSYIGDDAYGKLRRENLAFVLKEIASELGDGQVDEAGGRPDDEGGEPSSAIGELFVLAVALQAVLANAAFGDGLGKAQCVLMQQIIADTLKKLDLAG